MSCRQWVAAFHAEQTRSWDTPQPSKWRWSATRRRTTFPSLAIFLTVLAFNLLGDGLRDALDPKIDRR